MKTISRGEKAARDTAQQQNMIAFLGASTASFVAAPTLPALPVVRTRGAPPAVAMLENPLAKFFGGDDDKKKKEDTK